LVPEVALLFRPVCGGRSVFETNRPGTVDGGAEAQINLAIGAQVFDLLVQAPAPPACGAGLG